MLLPSLVSITVVEVAEIYSVMEEGCGELYLWSFLQKQHPQLTLVHNFINGIVSKHKWFINP